MGWWLLLTGGSGVTQIVHRVGRRIPTSQFLQLTPIAKIARWLNLPMTTPGPTMVNRAAVMVTRQFETRFFSLLWERLASSPFTFTNAIFAQQKSKLTTYNHWRVFLWGQGSAIKGRETHQRRVIGAILRGCGVGTPLEAMQTTAMLVAMGMLKHWWNTPPQKQEPKIVLPPPPPPKPRPRPRFEKLPEMPKFRKQKVRWTLRDLVVYALMTMGMSRAGANDLIDGKVIYGADADVYRRLCDLVFIRCIACDTMTAIEHNELMQAVIYIDETEELISWCPCCDGATLADVTALDDGNVVHLHKPE